VVSVNIYNKRETVVSVNIYQYSWKLSHCKLFR